ncbi:uncharacterized protein [Drosophila virilis]|uniref:Uncharacterized protein n=1 Tax=Drosophila virilis TaxID=7244 RepID=B4LTW6_DROVI|nr:uncharacterized protein LOC6628423 [Drosophila virilis]EDW64017.1 uncharacterized protein Dvir_GJ10100 [Drosophila virilis]
MSEPISSRGVRFIYNALLLTTSGLTARKLMPQEHPFALAACVVGGLAAVFGLLRAFLDDGSRRGGGGGGRASNSSSDGSEFRMLRNVTQSMLELMPLALVNMELYAHSLGLGAVALAHGIFVLPLLLDLRCSVVKNRKDCDLTETLRDLLVLGNIVSLGFLAAKERNLLYLRMTLTMLVVKYYPVLMDSAQEETGEDLIVCGNAYFLHVLGKVAAQWALQ